MDTTYRHRAALPARRHRVVAQRRAVPRDNQDENRIASPRNVPERIGHCLIRMLPSARRIVNRVAPQTRFLVRSVTLLSRPDLASPESRRAAERMRGAEPPGATRSAIFRASMARLASTGPSAKRAPRHTAHQSDHSAAAPTYKRYVTEPGPSESWSGIRGDRCQHWRFSGGRGAKHHLMCHLAPPFFQTALQRP